MAARFGLGMGVKRLCIPVWVALWLAGCSSMGGATASIPAPDVQVASKVPLAQYTSLAVVMPEYLETRPDMASRLRKLRVFGQVIRSEDLSGFVVSHQLQGQVGDLNKWSGYRSLARAYKPFLVFRFECVDARDGVRYRMIVTRADKLDNIFVGDVLVMSKARLEMIGLLTLGAGLRESNCFGATDHGAVDVLFASMSHWLHENLSSPMDSVRPPDRGAAAAVP